MRRFLALAATALTLLVGAAPAQQPVLPDGTVVPEAVLQISDDGPRMTTQVQIGGTGPYPFIVDTGSERTVISRELAGVLKLAAGPMVRVTAMTGTRPVGTVHIPGFQLNTLSGHDVDAPALASANLGAPGLIGVDTLRDKAVVIDFDRRTIEVRPSESHHRLAHFDGDVVVRGKNIYGQLVVTDASVNGTAVKLILDTGSVLSIGNLALRDRLHLGAGGDQVVLTSVTGDRLFADYRIASHVELGGIGIDHLAMGFADAEPFRRFGLEHQPALLLGMDALRLFRRVAIDFPNRRVLFALPKSAFPQWQPFHPSGFQPIPIG